MEQRTSQRLCSDGENESVHQGDLDIPRTTHQAPLHYIKLYSTLLQNIQRYQINCTNSHFHN